MTDDLKPCPFCGSPAEADYSRGYSQYPSGLPGTAVAIYCQNCSADMCTCREDHRGTDAEVLMDELVQAWNRRALPAASHPEAEKWLGELLAIIHRDGGHYQAQHGDEKAVNDAHVILARMFSQSEAEPPAPAPVVPAAGWSTCGGCGSNDPR